jgi:malate dehydrogenase (oxaloacetate-decarboxylating)
MKTFSMKVDALTGEEFYEVYIRGQQILADPLLNKGSSFGQEERLSLDLDGFLRSGFSNMKIQLDRNYEMFSRKTDPLEKFIFLQALLNRNETLFYRLLCDHLKEMVPIVYTPTVGTACLTLSHITRRYRGIYISPENIANIDHIFQTVNLPAVSLIVVTDGERILGLGDLGSDGMGIPVGKVNLYVAAGGLHPACCLPITLDVGTNTERLLEDPVYLGWRRRRLEGAEYENFIERFVLGVKRNFPDALLQWEDFAKGKAFKLLSRYRERVLSFNDDIQGTGATALSALITAMRIKKSTFGDQRFVIVGMGQAGSGIAYDIQEKLAGEGLSKDEIRKRIFAVEQGGLVLDSMPGLEPQMVPFAQPSSVTAGWKVDSPGTISLLDIVRNTKATVLIGVTAKPGLFDRQILTQMGANDARPVILALSNPTSKSECTAAEVYAATDGRALMASGSPFDPVEQSGRTCYTSQCNNMYVFPGVGLGALISKSPKVTDKMFLAASEALSRLVTEDQMKRGLLLPEMEDIRMVSSRIARAVACEARDSGIGRLLTDEQFDEVITKAQWDPHYYPCRSGKMDRF